jgi:membrane protein DedA with SNARE-associated domain
MTLLTMGFQGTLQWILHHGYPLLFILMLVEGPVVTAAGAFAAALHYFNIWAVLLLSIFGNLIPDAIYYALGFWGRAKFIGKYGRYLGITKERIAITEKLAKKHSGKSMLTIKMIPFLATPGLIVMGASHMDIKKYAFWSFIITVPTSLFYLVLGYYFGAAYDRIDHYLHLGIYLVIIAFVVIGVIAYFQRRYSEKLLKGF